MIRLIGLNMSNSRSQNRRPQRGSNGTENTAMVRAEEHQAVKEELNRVKEQVSKLQENLERTIHSKGQLLTLNCRLVEDLKMANMPLTQAYKVFGIRQKAELHQEIAELAILNEVTKADHDALKNSIFSWLPPLMQHRKSTAKDLKRKMSAKDSGLEIGAAPRMSRDMQLLIAENQALKYDVETLKDQLKSDQHIRQQMLLGNAEVQNAAAVDSEPISEKNDSVTYEIADKHPIEGTVEDDPGAQSEAVTEPEVQNQDEMSSEEAIKEQQSPEVTKPWRDAEVCLLTAVESGMPPAAESGMPPVAEFGMPTAGEQKDDFSSETQSLEEVGQSQAVMKQDGMVDMCQEDEAVFEKTNKAKETIGVTVEEAINRKVATQDGYHTTEGESVVEDIAEEQDIQDELVEKMTEHLAEVTGDNQLILQDEDEVISQLYAVSTRLQNAYDEAAELAEELELDKLSSKLSYDAILQGLKDNFELKMTDHQKEVQQMELKVKEEKTLREEEQAKVKALEEELNQIRLESKALKESQNAEIEKLREAVLEIGSRYSKSQDDYNEETKRVKTTLKACAVKMKEFINANTGLKDENNILRARLTQLIDKLNNETSVLRDQLASYGDKLDKEVKIRKGLEERNAELYTRLQEQEDVISELQAKKRRKKGWRRFIFCS